MTTAVRTDRRPTREECLKAFAQVLAPGYRRWKEAQAERLRQERATEAAGAEAHRKGA